MESICFNKINWLSEFDILYTKGNDDSSYKDLIPESFTSNCFSCGVKFTSFLSRPNRCAMCSKLFCSSCISKLKYKLCKNCLLLCQLFNNIIKKELIETKEHDSKFLEMKETYYCKNIFHNQSDWRNFVSSENNSFENKLLDNMNDTYELIMKTLINYVIKINFGDETIISEWKNIIYILIKETISNLRPCTRYLGDTVDINNYVKIKIIPYKDTSMCQVIQGYVLHNKKKSNNIKSNIENPKILLLNNELNNEIDNELNNTEKKEKNDSNIDNIEEDIQIYHLKLIENKIDKIRPDIVIIGKDFPKDKIDIINNNNFYGISVIYDIENNVMKRLSRCLQTLILPSIKLIGRNNILGTCKRFYIQNIADINGNIAHTNNDNKEENNKESDKDRNNNEGSNDLYIFDGCGRFLFNTIILSGQDIDLLKKMKKLLRQILLPSIWDLFLQKYFQYTFNMEINAISEDNEIEVDFIEELYAENNEIIPLKSGYNSAYKEKDKERRSLNCLKYSSQKSDKNQLFYEGFDLSIIDKKENFNIYTIISLKSSQKNKTEINNININDENIDEITEKEIHNIVNKYCDESKDLNFSFFNRNYDYTLGNYILKLCKKSNEICPKCNLIFKKHTQYLYRSEGVLKIWEISGNEFDFDKIAKYLNNKTSIDYSKILPYKNIIYSTTEINDLDIYTYGYCKICKGIVTPLFKLSNEVYNYSASKFLRFMLENHLSKNQHRNFKFNISNLIANNDCQHIINKEISRIFVTRFGSYVFEYNEIVKHYISPLNINTNDSFSKNFLFQKYEDEGYANCTKVLSLISKTLASQENFFKELLNDDKLFLFKELFINKTIEIIESIKNFSEQYMLETVIKYLKTNNDKYNNSYVRLIAYIKKLYLKIMKIKLIVNQIERMKRNIKIISDILNNQIPITLEENNKLIESSKKKDGQNQIEPTNSKINFKEDSSFRNILSFINYADNKHDYYSCEFIQDDLTSYIANTISSNEYIKSMKLKNGLNLTAIKCNRYSIDVFSSEIAKNINKIKRFSSFKQLQEKNHFFGEIDKGISRSLSLDENTDIGDLFDIMLIFDQSKQNFFVEGEKAINFPNKLIKEILEGEIVSKEIEHKTFILKNDLYSLLLKPKKNEDENKVFKTSTSENILFPNNVENHEIFKTATTKNIKPFKLALTPQSSETFKNETEENERLDSIIISSKKDFKKIHLYFKEMEQKIYDTNEIFKELTGKLAEIIKNKIDNQKLKESQENKDNNKINNKENIKENIIKENNIKDNNIKENNEDTSIPNIYSINSDEIIDTNVNSNIEDRIENVKNNNNNKEENIKKDNNIEQEKIIPIYPSVPEFEKIFELKKHYFFEERAIFNDELNKENNKDNNKIEIIIYYARQFEALRIAYCATMEDFLISLSQSDQWTENTGGKSKASFYKTSDNKFILKNVSEYEFNMLLDNCLEYFHYMSRFLFHKMPSALAKILGAYKITTKHKNKEVKYHLILMENIYYGTISKDNTFNCPESNIRVYDLKGSNINRYINKSKRKAGQVLLDTNFLVDFNREPVFIDSYIYDRLKLALYNDTNYLKKNGVVDYSLFIIFNDKEKSYKKEDIDKSAYYDFSINSTSNENSKRLIKLGIIDYIRKYTWDKKMEFYGKSLLYGENPTIVEPNVYSERFYKKIIAYFVGV